MADRARGRESVAALRRVVVPPSGGPQRGIWARVLTLETWGTTVWKAPWTSVARGQGDGRLCRPYRACVVGGARDPGRRGSASLAACPGLYYRGLTGLRTRERALAPGVTTVEASWSPGFLSGPLPLRCLCLPLLSLRETPLPIRVIRAVRGITRILRFRVLSRLSRAGLPLRAHSCRFAASSSSLLSASIRVHLRFPIPLFSASSA